MRRKYKIFGVVELINILESVGFSCSESYETDYNHLKWFKDCDEDEFKIIWTYKNKSFWVWFDMVTEKVISGVKYENRA